MGRSLNVTSLLVGGMLMLVGAIAFFTHRTRPDRVRGLTHKQFLWLCVVAFVCGAFVAVAQFILPE